VCGGHSAHDDRGVRAEGPAVSAASQRKGHYTPCWIKHGSEYTTEDRSTAVHAADNTTAGNDATDDGVWAGGQEEQQRQLAATEVDVLGPVQ
jgi:hypothetical protein